MNIEEFNRRKQVQLINNIMNCHGDYQLVCIDVDDVMYNTDAIMQEILASIDARATKEYRGEISRETSEDSLAESQKSFAILDAILEEYPYLEEQENGIKKVNNYPKIDYSKIYKPENLIPGSIEAVNQMLENREKNYFFIYLSHRNPEREGLEKMLQLYKLTPKIDAILTLPYHIEVGSKEVSSKGAWVKQSLALDNLNNCILIDNSKSNCKDWRKQGGIDIRYLTTGFKTIEDYEHPEDYHYNLEDHLLRLPSLDPYAIQFALSGIKYIRENTNYLDTINDNQKVLRK